MSLRNSQKTGSFLERTLNQQYESENSLNLENNDVSIQDQGIYYSNIAEDAGLPKGESDKAPLVEEAEAAANIEEEDQQLKLEKDKKKGLMHSFNHSKRKQRNHKKKKKIKLNLLTDFFALFVSLLSPNKKVDKNVRVWSIMILIWSIIRIVCVPPPPPPPSPLSGSLFLNPSQLFQHSSINFLPRILLYVS